MDTGLAHVPMEALADELLRRIREEHRVTSPRLTIELVAEGDRVKVLFPHPRVPRADFDAYDLAEDLGGETGRAAALD